MQKQLKNIIRSVLPRDIKAHTIMGGRLKGTKIVTSWHDYPGAIRGTTEAPLLDFFAANARAGETWLDVGAHYGYTAISLSRLVGTQGRVFAFEPVLASAGAIARTREMNSFSQLRIEPFGLSSIPGIQSYKLATTRGMADSNLTVSGWEEQFLVASFDELWASINEGNPHVDGVKIDVQGMEYKTLQGMRRMLKEFVPKLVLEFHINVNRQEILTFLDDCGYDTKGRLIGEPSPVPAAEELEDDKSYYFAPKK